jgi:hypothetical protein
LAQPASGLPAANAGYLCGRLVLIFSADKDGYGRGLRTNIEADAATRTARSFVGHRIIAQPVKDIALCQHFGWTRLDAETASLAQVTRDLNIAAIRVSHHSLQIRSKLSPDAKKVNSKPDFARRQHLFLQKASGQSNRQIRLAPCQNPLVILTSEKILKWFFISVPNSYNRRKKAAQQIHLNHCEYGLA